MSGRRAMLAASLVAFATCLAPAHAQSPNRIYRLGVLAPTADSVRLTRDLTLPELATLGFIEGRNLVFDARSGARSELPVLMRELLVFVADDPGDYPAAFAAMRTAGMQALMIGADPEFAPDGALLAALALEAGQPTSCEWASMAQAGCLLGYGPDRGALRRRMAHQVAGIFRGAAADEVIE